MFIKDRGNIKWTSLMLVEHKRALEKLKVSDNFKKKPELDEQELKRLDRLFKQALKSEKLSHIVYYRKGEFKEIDGIIKKYLPQKRQLIIKTNNEKIYLSIDKIIKIEID